MNCSWSVVKFLEDGLIEAVPSSWLDGEWVSWPPVAGKLITAIIKKCEPAAPSWPKHQTKIMTRVTFDTYLKAREKARLAEDTSDLQSDAPPAKRRRIVPSRFWSSENSDNENQHLDKSTQDIQPCSSNEQYVEEHLEYEEERIDEYTLEEQLKEIHGTDTSSVQSTPIEHVAVPSCSGCRENAIKLESLTTQLCLLRALQVDTLQEIKHVRREMVTGRAADERATSFFTAHNINFPLETMDDLSAFNDILNNQVQFKNAVKELADYGGADNYNFVKRVMTSMLSNEVAIRFSWLGRKEKEDFHRLPIARLVICAAKQGKMAATDKETELSMQGWLKRNARLAIKTDLF